MKQKPKSECYIDLFIGAPLTHMSDLEALRTAYEAVQHIAGWAYICANFHAKGRQIDVAIFTETTSLVIEAKSYRQPITGGTNGQWEQQGSYKVRKVRNAYEQTLEAKNAVRDEMQGIGLTHGYPNALVAVIPSIPNGSAIIPGDAKVKIGAQADILPMLKTSSSAVLTESQCKALVRKLALERVPNLDALADPAVLEAARLCDEYTRSFQDFYGPLCSNLIEDQYHLQGVRLSRAEIIASLLECSEPISIIGPSGCGKSLLSTKLAMCCISYECVPIFVAAKDFEGKFSALLGREVALLCRGSLSDILRASHMLERQIILFIDGLNEAPVDSRTLLLRSMAAFASRTNAKIVTSAREDLCGKEPDADKKLFVSVPSIELKSAIAGAEDKGVRSRNCEDLLQAVNSGLEARLVGQIGALMAKDANRFALFYTYSRFRLGSNAVQGVELLVLLSRTLAERACLSLAIWEFERLLSTSNMNNVAWQDLVDSRLLNVRSGRVSFAHELFYTAFLAEAVVRESRGDAEKIRAAIRSPRFHTCASLIIGAIGDHNLLKAVIEEIDDQKLLAACYAGECGVIPRSIVESRISVILEALVEASSAVTFKVAGDGWTGLVIEHNALCMQMNRWHNCFGAISVAICQGRYIETILRVCEIIDARLVRCEAILREESLPKNISLRDALFAQMYAWPTSESIFQILGLVRHSDFPSNRAKNNELDYRLHQAWLEAKTPGQIYFLLGVTRVTGCYDPLKPYIVGFLSEIERFPYHIQLDLLDVPLYFNDVDERCQAEMTVALEAAFGKVSTILNSSIFDALESLGALEVEAKKHVTVVKAEIQSALDTQGTDGDHLAWSIYSRQFDHPFSLVYWEEVQGLAKDRQKSLFTKACRGAESPYVSFLGSLIERLSDFLDPTVSAVILPWTELPASDHFMPQEAVDVFLTAYEAMGKLNVGLPSYATEALTAGAKALIACGELLYSCKRADVSDIENAESTLKSRTTLLELAGCASAGALFLASSRTFSFHGERRDLSKKFPNLLRAICRETLKRPEAQISYYRLNSSADKPAQAIIVCFAIQLLGELGDETDLLSLRLLCDDQNLGRSALDAIEMIETRAVDR